MANESRAEADLARVLARTLRSQRLEKGLTQEDVAARAGIDKNHYQLMESALSDRKSNSPLNPRLATLVKVADALNTDIVTLLVPMAEAYAFVRAQGGGLTATSSLPPRSQEKTLLDEEESHAQSFVEAQLEKQLTLQSSHSAETDVGSHQRQEPTSSSTSSEPHSVR